MNSLATALLVEVSFSRDHVRGEILLARAPKRSDVQASGRVDATHVAIDLAIDEGRL